jgi:hypothetical protein
MKRTCVPTILALFSGALLLAAGPADDSTTSRKPNPGSRQIPERTGADASRADEIIDRFIDYDTGKLRGPEGKQALTDFNQLGPEAIPALIRGLNRAATIDHSCPAVTIARKLGRMLSASRDAELLEFARENIGAGVTHSKHMGVIKDLRVLCIVRKSALGRNTETLPQTAPGLESLRALTASARLKEFRNLSMGELIASVGTERGTRLKMVLTELGRRGGDVALDALASAAAAYEGDTQQHARDLLTRQLSDLKEPDLRERLKDDRAAVRAAAARVVGRKGLHWEGQMIDLLDDDEEVVRAAAHETLVRLSKGTDWGPQSHADEVQRKEAVRKWRAWLAGQGGR